MGWCIWRLVIQKEDIYAASATSSATVDFALAKAPLSTTIDKSLQKSLANNSISFDDNHRQV